LSDDPVLKTETLYNLSFEEVDNNIVKIVIQLISDEDKSVNAASNFLIQNSNPLIPASVIDFISSPDISIRNLAVKLLRKGVESLDAICKRLPEIKDDDDIKFWLIFLV
jgi:hypothetical protein